MNIDEYFDEIYVINLDDRQDRWRSVTSELRKANINKYKRLPAVKINAQDFQNLPSTAYDRFQEKDTGYIEGSMGCKLSHLACIKEAKANNYDKILILEDDVIITEDANLKFNKVLTQLNKWDMLYLGGRYKNGGFYANGSKWEQEQVSDNLLKLKGAMLASSYGLSKNIYDTILNNAFQSGQEMDIFYYAMHQFRKDYTYYGAIPEIMVQLETDSDIR